MATETDFDLDEGPTRKRMDPEDMPVQLNVRVPWHYREQLIEEAADQGISLNRFITRLLVRQVRPRKS